MKKLTEDILHDGVGDQLGTAQNHTAGDTIGSGVGNGDCLLAVGGQQDRSIHAASQSTAAHAVGEVIAVCALLIVYIHELDV